MVIRFSSFRAQNFPVSYAQSSFTAFDMMVKIYLEDKNVKTPRENGISVFHIPCASYLAAKK